MMLQKRTKSVSGKPGETGSTDDDARVEVELGEDSQSSGEVETQKRGGLGESHISGSERTQFRSGWRTRNRRNVSFAARGKESVEAHRRPYRS